jgi:hypothetical protein
MGERTGYYEVSVQAPNGIESGTFDTSTVTRVAHQDCLDTAVRLFARSGFGERKRALQCPEGGPRPPSVAQTATAEPGTK